MKHFGSVLLWFHYVFHGIFNYYTILRHLAIYAHLQLKTIFYAHVTLHIC